jgi:hypothetical protein
LATRRRAASKTITGAVSDLQRRVRYLQAATPPSRLATQVVARTNVRPRAINSDQIELAAVTNDQIAADAVKLANMGTNSVGNAQIIDGSIDNAKLDADSVDNQNLRTDAVTSDKIQNSSVITDKIGNLAVTTGKLANSSVDESKITSSAVTADKIRNGAVGRSKIQDRAVGTSQISDNAVTTGQLGNSSVTSEKLGSGSVTSGKIGSGQVRSTQIGNRAVTRDKIALGAVGPDELGTGSVLSTKLAVDSVTSAKISTTTMSIIVSRGLQTGFGISKSGNTISVNTTSLNNQYARGNHRHNYTDRYGVVGQVSSTGLTGFPVVTSSIKRKKDVQDYELKNPKNLLNLKFKKFKYKRPDSNYHTQANREWMHGYIIEELMDLGFDEVIHYDKDGNPEKLDYSLFSALVLELVKVQQQEIDCLQEKVKKLEKNDIPI